MFKIIWIYKALKMIKRDIYERTSNEFLKVTNKFDYWNYYDDNYGGNDGNDISVCIWEGLMNIFFVFTSLCIEQKILYNFQL